MTVEDLTSASGTWVVPDGVTSVVAEVYSDGGGGKSTNPVGSPGFCGGAGSYRKATIPVTPGQSISYTVGQGGAGGGAGQNGFAGTGSSFGDYIVCTGGGGGLLTGSTGSSASGTATPDVSLNGPAGTTTQGGTCPGPLGGAGGLRANPAEAGHLVGGGGGARLGGANLPGAAGARGLIRLTYTGVATPISGEGASAAPAAESSGTAWVLTDDSDALTGIRAAIAGRNGSRANIGVFGASVVEGYPAPIDNWIETQLAQKLRAKYPTDGLDDDGGYGYIGIPTSGLQNTATTPVGYVQGTFNESLGWGGHHRVWVASTLQTSPGLSLTLTDDATSVVIETVGGATGHAVGGRYRINGGSWVTFNTFATSAQSIDVTVPGPLSAGDVIEIAHNTTGTGNVVVSGFRVYKGDENKGIQVHNHGHYGYRIQDWNVARSAADPGWLSTMLDYDLIIFSDWGGNDGSGPGDLSAADFKTAFDELITWMRTSGYAGDILIASLYKIVRTFVDPWSEYVDAMREVAADQEVAFIQLDQFMPDPPGPLYDADNIHGNADGSAYDLMSDLFYAKIVPLSDLADYGEGTATAPAADSAGTGTVRLTGSGTATASGADSSGTGSLKLTGAGDSTAPAADANGDAVLTITGAGDASAPPTTTDGAGQSTLEGDGTATAPAAESSGSGALTLTGAGSSTAPASRSKGHAVGAGEIAGTGSAAAPTPSAHGDGQLAVTGEGQSVSAAALTSGTGGLSLAGSGASEAPPASARGEAGAPTITGAGGAAAPASESQGTGVLRVVGVGELEAAAAVAAGEALLTILGVGSSTAPAAVAKGDDGSRSPVHHRFTFTERHREFAFTERHRTITITEVT